LQELVEQILRAPRQNTRTSLGAEAAARLALLGDGALPVVAGFLGDGGLPWEAENALLQDKTRAAPFVLAAVPNMRGQYIDMALSAYRRLAAEDSTFAFRHELYDAARFVLDRDRLHLEAILTLGVVGTAADESLLEEIYRERAATLRSGASFDRVFHAAGAALARLGSAVHVEHIKAGLRARVRKEDDATIFERFAEDAEFVGRQDFVPLLCGHVNDRSWWHGDVVNPPSWIAMSAVYAITHTPVTPTSPREICGKS
jgi:hypothetical protein